MYRLKPNVADFEHVDGQFAGRAFRSGEQYQEIPPTDANKFDEVTEAAPAIKAEVAAEDIEEKRGGRK